MYNVVESCRKMLEKNDVEKYCRIMFVSNSTENIVANNIRQKDCRKTLSNILLYGINVM